jgi:hypothetical protein
MIVVVAVAGLPQGALNTVDKFLSRRKPWLLLLLMLLLLLLCC